jgi:hypothetical protein
VNDLRDDQEAADSPTWLGDTIAELKGRGFERVNDPNARHDQEAADAATHARLRAVTQPAHVLTPAQLRTVPAPNLRSPAARQLDGETRDLRPYDERADERLARIEAAIERIADAVTVLMLERELGGTVQGKRRMNGYE